MGLSGMLLKQKDEIIPKKLIEDIKLAAQSAELILIVSDKTHYKEDGSFDFTTANLANTFEEMDGQEEFLMYICGKSENIFDAEYDFIIENGKLNRVVIIDEFHGSEKILLDFVYEYLKLNPNDIFWYDMDWYYSLDDIEIINGREFDRDWPYKKPDWK
jgi:hypothetical protein